MKTAVTGGAGFIGSHLVKRLVQLGREVAVIDDLSRGQREYLAGIGVPGQIGLHVVDLRDYRACLEALESAESVFHLAARVGSIEMLHGSEKAELLALGTNLVIDATVFRACMAIGVKRIVFASSVAIYPIDLQSSLGAVIREDDAFPINPEGGYGWAKLMGEVQLGWMLGVDISIARLFNIYGEHEEPDQDAHVVPALMRKAILFPKDGFRVWGDGSQTRDMLYVGDAVEALIRLEQVATFPPLVVNVGSGEAISIRRLVDEVIRISGKSIKPVYDRERPVGPLSRTADIARASAALGWTPRASLEDGLQMTYRWVQERLTGKSEA